MISRATHVTHVKDEVRRELALDLKTPVVHHSRTSVTRREVSGSSEAASKASVILGRIEIGRRRIRGNARIEQERWYKALAPARRSRKSIRQRLTKVPVSERRVVDGVATPDYRVPQP